MKPVVVSGVIANKHRAAGAIWTRLNWTLGLRKLGFDVYFVEQMTGASAAAVEVFQSVMERFGLSQRCALMGGEDEILFGVELPLLQAIARDAEALINISGHLACPALFPLFRRKVYIDLDPGFTQIWHATGVSGARLEGHDLFFTIGENIGAPACAIPTNGIRWQPTRQPVVLELWPELPPNPMGAFRTIASWRGPYGPIEFNGQQLGLKVHEWRKLLDLPRASGTRFEIALDIHPADQRDIDALREHGWSLAEPSRVAGDLDAVRRYVRDSKAEFSVAQGVYVGTNSGWVSDRTVCYLASGRPAVVQETGFSANHPAAAGLLPFRTFDEAVAAVREVERNYLDHCRAAREIAERDFASEKVLSELADAIGIVP